jgi:hypothetical protein
MQRIVCFDDLNDYTLPSTCFLLFTALAPHGDRLMHYTIAKQPNNCGHRYLLHCKQGSDDGNRDSSRNIGFFLPFVSADGLTGFYQVQSP